jgi:hypothetical protein
MYYFASNHKNNGRQRERGQRHFSSNVRKKKHRTQSINFIFNFTQFSETGRMFHIDTMSSTHDSYHIYNEIIFILYSFLRHARLLQHLLMVMKLLHQNLVTRWNAAPETGWWTGLGDSELPLGPGNLLPIMFLVDVDSA